MLQMALGVDLCSAMLHVSRAHLRYDPQGCVSRDVGEAPTLPRNARDITMRYRTPPRGPARTASDRPSSSRSSGSSYYPRTGSGSWGAPRAPTHLPEAQCATLVSSTGYLPENPGTVSPHRGTRWHHLPFLIVFFFSPITCRIYYLEVIQQPEVSAEFGSAALSRLPLAPPLVAQLIIRDSSSGNVIES